MPTSLTNGNTLYNLGWRKKGEDVVREVDLTGKKLIEIAPDGTIVWQMIAPAGSKNRRKFHKAIRIGVDGETYGG